MIFGSVLQVILGLDEWGLDVSQAIEYGRVYDQLYPSTVAVDSIIPDDIVKALEDRHHNVTGSVLFLVVYRCIANMSIY